MLQNLLDNAWKFTSRRDDALIEFGTTPVADADVCCYVRDNGAGFDPAYVGKLFTPFQRLHTTREFPGTGVGLASVRQIVERHGRSRRGPRAPSAKVRPSTSPWTRRKGHDEPSHPAGRGQPRRRSADAPGPEKNNILNEVTVAHDGAEALDVSLPGGSAD